MRRSIDGLAVMVSETLELKAPLDKLKQWLDKNQPLILPKGLLGKAITYTQNQWPYVTRYIDDGLLDIDNNAAVRAIKIPSEEARSSA